jgi:hypothetical protein
MLVHGTLAIQSCFTIFARDFFETVIAEQCQCIHEKGSNFGAADIRTIARLKA